MAKPILAVAIDIFSPSAYRAAEWPSELGPVPDFVEDYSHEKDFVYIVLQPFIFRGAADIDTFPVAITSDPALYFARGRTLEASDVVYADCIDQGKLPTGVEPVPVPLPPGTSIELKLVRGADTLWQSQQRKIGLTGSSNPPESPFVLRLDEWPPIASVNFAHPLATTFEELDASQAEEVYVWLAAAIVDLIRAKRKGDSLSAKQGDVLEIFCRSTNWNLLKDNPPSTWEKMREHLKSANRGADMYKVFLDDKDTESSVRLTPPRFKVVDPSAFERRIHAEIGNDLPLGATQASYLYVWWQTISRQAVDPITKDAWPDLAVILGRYFGFGERLRWPQPPFDVVSAANEVFMVPVPRSKSSPKLLETNAASLCELVFRIPISVFDGDITTLQAKVSVAGNLRDDATLAAESQLGPHWARLASLSTKWKTTARCRAVVRRDTVDEAGQPLRDAHGIVMVQPRAAQCIPVDNPKARGLFAVPGLLLEFADESPRHSIGDGDQGLVAEREPRRALFPEECLAFDNVLKGTTRWRIQGELRPAAIITVPETPPAPRVYEFIAARLSRIPVRGVAQGVATTEADRFKHLLPELLVRDGTYRADLWMPNGAGVFPMEGRLLDADGPASDLRFYILDEDPSNPSNGIGHVWPDTSKTGRDTVLADLVIEVVNGKSGTATAQATLPFNLVKSGESAPWIALNRSALSRVGRSVDRWLERFHVLPTVEGPITADDLLRDHLLNFNKLRVFTYGETDTYIPVTYPDAAVPLKPAAHGKYAESLPWAPSGGGWPSQPPFTYFVGHLYSQENTAQRTKIGDPDLSLDREPESIRYVRYARARGKEHLAGYVEHQYSYRIPIIQTNWTADARIATDVRNPAALVVRSKGTATTKGDAANTEGIRASFLELRIADDGKALLIAGCGEYFKNIFEAESQLRTLHVETLRAIYEAVRDMKHAIEGGNAALQAALFRFDNSLPSQRVLTGSADSLPTRLDRFVTGILSLRADQGVGAKLLQGVSSLTPDSFRQFADAIDTLRSGSNADVFPPIPVRMDDPDWVWQEAGAARPAPDLQREANVVRLALDLRRPPELVVDPDSANGRLIPFTSESDTAIPSWIKDNIGDVLGSARDELYSLLDRPANGQSGSSLYFRRGWLHAEPPKGNVAIEPSPDGDVSTNVESREGRWRIIFGDYASTLLVPLGEMRSVPQVAELFYIPLAFRPLATHPALGTANDTLAFAEFLVGVAGDLLEGRAPEEILLAVSAAGAAADGASGRLRLQELIDKDAGIAQTLQQLISPVHNDGDLRKNPGKLTQRALDLWDRAQPQLATSIRLLLAQSPQVFSTARAIGAVMFDPARFARPLHSIQLCKRITQQIATANQSIIDVDRYVIPPSPVDKLPLLLDPLEAASYDAEFELPMNTYRLASGNPATDTIYDAPIDLSQGVTLISRGGASGRSGEDFIESRHHFPQPEASSAEPRAIEVDAPHWNRHWAYEIKNAQDAKKKLHLYLLPSRRFPTTPVPLQVAAVTPDRPGEMPLAVNISPINLRTADSGNANDVFRQTLLDSLRELNGVPLVIRSDGADTSKHNAMWCLDATTNAVVDDHADADGWYRIDTFLEHHYFMVEAGETGESPFANDLFEIEVQVNRSGTAGDPDAISVVEASSTVLHSSPLVLAFRRSQQKRGKVSVGATPLAAPDANEAMTVTDLVESISYWLCASAADSAKVLPQERNARGNTALLRDVPFEESEPTNVQFRSRYEYSTPSRSTLKLEKAQSSADPLSQRIGCVITVSMMKQIETAELVRGERAIIRVSVLADPWSRLRVRMRQIRNRRDIDGGQPDINPVFEMPSTYSSWSAYTHAEVVMDATKFAELQVPESERKLDVTEVTLSDWLQTRATNNPPMIGKMVEARLNSKVPGTGPYAGKLYWNSHEMLDAQRTVSMVLRQRQPDRHMWHDGNTWGSLRARDLMVPRHVFGAVPANGIDAQLQEVAPKAVTAGEPELEITWLDKSTAGPVCRVAWPIRFKFLKN